jgi:DNA-binding NarL/FixJ family response regulator
MPTATDTVSLRDASAPLRRETGWRDVAETLHTRSTRMGRDQPHPSLVSVDTVETTRTSDKDVIGVLIAYGDNFARRGLYALLSTEPGIAVVGCAADGDETVALARQIQPDVLLVDIALPGIDGVQLARRLALDADACTARVLILGVCERDEDVFSSLRAGASGFARRDIEPAELLRAVRTVAAGDAALSPRVVSRMIAELASRPDPRLAAPDQLEELTAREREVMALVAAGLTNDQIAEHLVVTLATARTHVSRTLRKLGVRSRAQLVTLAYETGLVLPTKTADAGSGILAAKYAA